MSYAPKTERPTDFPAHLQRLNHRRLDGHFMLQKSKLWGKGLICDLGCEDLDAVVGWSKSQVE